MHMVRRRCSAFGAIVDDEVAGEGGCQIEHGFEPRCDPLRAMSPVRDSQMAVDDWKRVAVKREIAPEGQSFLFRGKIFRAQKASAARDRFPVNRGGGTADAMGNMAEENFGPIGAHRARAGSCEAFHSLRKLRPRFELALEQRFDLIDHRRIRAWISMVRSQSL